MQNSTGILCRTQNLINKKNFSRQSNNKFRDRPHMIQAEFENGIEDENNFQIQEYKKSISKMELMKMMLKHHV